VISTFFASIKKRGYIINFFVSIRDLFTPAQTGVNGLEELDIKVYPTKHGTGAMLGRNNKP
jgi:hypothetical protein